MKYRKVFFDEANQKVRWTMNNTSDLAITYEYLGTMSRVEIDLLVETLWELYGDENITFADFARYFGELRTFCDQLKKITS